MKVFVRIRGTKKEIRIRKDAKLLDLLKKIKINPDGIIALVKDLPVPIDTILENEDEIELLFVASGG
ncbi:MAG: MoaD/ThiS family protein [Candidatus Thermoplasmatota archaeon]